MADSGKVQECQEVVVTPEMVRAAAIAFDSFTQEEMDWDWKDCWKQILVRAYQHMSHQKSC